MDSIFAPKKEHRTIGNYFPNISDLCMTFVLFVTFALYTILILISYHVFLIVIKKCSSQDSRGQTSRIHIEIHEVGFIREVGSQVL